LNTVLTPTWCDSELTGIFEWHASVSHSDTELAEHSRNSLISNLSIWLNTRFHSVIARYHFIRNDSYPRDRSKRTTPQVTCSVNFLWLLTVWSWVIKWSPLSQTDIYGGISLSPLNKTHEIVRVNMLIIANII